MKKLISMMLCIVMVLSMIFVLAACGKSESSSNASDSEIEYITEADATDSSIPYTEPAASDSDIS